MVGLGACSQKRNIHTRKATIVAKPSTANQQPKPDTKQKKDNLSIILLGGA